ncbi:hypothetical protein B7463_g2866, partial [Scytalidium lignicola]
MEEDKCQSSTTDRNSIDGIMSPEDPNNDSSQEASNMPPPSQPNTQHTRARSSISRRPNRLSLVFPVAPSTTGTESAKQTPTSSTAPSLPATPAEAARSITPNDSGGFLVALAAQERKVLELKEELSKAEADLLKLKKQWAMHEASKKTSKLRNAEQIQALQNLTAEGRKSIEEQTNLKRSIELERRKSLLGGTNAPKDSRRRIITGGHTRTLSLLSPDSSTYVKSFESSQESNPQTVGLSRSTTMPDTSQGITRISSRLASRHSYQSGATGVKQIADDVKAGLWTFLEDLRQATVGDEAITGVKKQPNTNNDAQHNGINRKASKGSLSGSSNGRGKAQVHTNKEKSEPRTWDTLTGNNAALFDVAGTLWEDQTRQSLKGTKATRKQAKSLSLAPAVVSDFDDDWSNWDSPPPKSPTRWSGSTAASDTAITPLKAGVDEDDTKNIEETTHEITWPGLDQLTPGHLKRTVTTLMSEWEKALTPPASTEQSPSRTPANISYDDVDKLA